MVGPLAESWMFKRNALEILSELTAKEKQFLRAYIDDGENTKHAPINDGVACGLVAKKILYRASNLSLPGMPGMIFPYNMQPHARKILRKKPELIR